MHRILMLTLLLAVAAGTMTQAQGAAEPTLGEIMLFSGDYEPRGWARCDGRLLPIARNTALFSLLGTTYGGDGRSNFALPDLRGRVPVGTGAMRDGEYFVPGQKAGSTAVAFKEFGLTEQAVRMDAGADTELVRLPLPADQNKAVNNHAPYQCIGYFIALEGIYPMRQ